MLPEVPTLTWGLPRPCALQNLVCFLNPFQGSFQEGLRWVSLFKKLPAEMGVRGFVVRMAWSRPMLLWGVSILCEILCI